jgi:hypothetical protein
VETGLAIDDMSCDAVVGSGARKGNIALAQVLEHFFDGAFEGISQAAAAGAFDADGIVSP